MKLRGIVYDVGTAVNPHFHSRREFDEQQTSYDMDTIVGALPCNAVRIVGTDPRRLIVATRMAVERDLRVCLSPQLHNADAETTLGYLQTCASALHRVGPAADDAIFAVGHELSWNMRDIMRGSTFARRVMNPFARMTLRWSPRPAARLNAFLSAAAATVRREHDGPLTYAAAPIERVDWSPFDYIGLNYCGEWTIGGAFGSDLGDHISTGKRVILTELGLGTYVGADDFGASGWAVARTDSGRLELDSMVQRSEEVQARELIRMLDTTDRAGADGAFVYTFASPSLPYDRDPAADLDTASYSVVKTSRPGAGVTQSWEPKLAFADLGRYYRSIGERA